jgi:hypothetical protein
MLGRYSCNTLDEALDTAPAASNSSGNIGLQAETGKVAFRHIRLQKK